MINPVDLGNGQFRIMINMGYGDNGKRLRPSKVIYADSIETAKIETEKYEKELISLTNNTTVAKSVEPMVKNENTHTFIELVDCWKNTPRRKPLKPLKPKTVRRYYEYTDYMISYFGDVNIEKLMHYKILKYLDYLTKPGSRRDKREDIGYSEQTVFHHYKLLLELLNFAVRQKWLTENLFYVYETHDEDNNPTNGMYDNIESLIRNGPTNKEVVVYEKDEIKEILATIRNDDTVDPKYKVFIELAFKTGLRESELIGLKWQDISFDKRIIHLNRNIQYVPKMGLFPSDSLKGLKTGRAITISSRLTQYLMKYQAYQQYEIDLKKKNGDPWEDNDLLFTQKNGKPMYPATPYGWYKKYTKKCGLRFLCIHGFRHTYASELLSKGRSIKSVADGLGHTTTTMVELRYGHTLHSDAEACATDMDDY